MDLMEFHISIFFIIEVIGTVAFASSGAMVAIKQQLDLLGVAACSGISYWAMSRPDFS